MKKNKFIDKCKSWLLTLGVASVFGLAALGVNAAKSYDKASAYEYQDNGELTFLFIQSTGYDYDIKLFVNYIIQCDYGVDYECVCEMVGHDDNDVPLEFGIIQKDIDSEYIYYNIFDSVSNFSLLEVVCNSDNSLEEFTLNPDAEELLSPFTFTMLPSFGGYQQLRNYALSYNVPQQSGNFITALTSFMSLLGGAIVQLATPVASGVTSFASSLFIDNSHLSIMGGIIGIFAGIVLAVGITSKVYAWVSTLGN